MKILFDENISFRVVRELRKIWPECRSLADVDLGQASDTKIWNFAKQNHFAIATYDEDFLDLLAIRGGPPKIIYVRLQNANRSELYAAFERNAKTLEAFLRTEDIFAYFLF